MNDTQRSKQKTRWMKIVRGNGMVTGYLEVFWSPAFGGWVSVPGVSRSTDVYGVIIEAL